MKKFFIVMFWIIATPVMLFWASFKTLIDMADGMERSRKRRSKHTGVMCSAGGSRKR